MSKAVAEERGEEADSVLEAASPIRLSGRDAKTMWDLVENPPEPNENLKAALEIFKKNVRA